MEELREARAVIVAGRINADRHTQRLQLEDNVTIMKLARINDERERNIPYSILWSVESRQTFNGDRGKQTAKQVCWRNRMK